tara:strand:+ start:577 stop:981 length:405 start_codon:yes stop_codon:yes gene_type:complete
MITQVSETDFIDAFQAIRPHNFTYNGLKTLYAYLEDLSDDIGEEFKLDVIGICCDFEEYKNWAEFEDIYGNTLDSLNFQVKKPCCDICIPYWNDKRLEKLSERTTVIPISEEFTSMDINGIMSSNKEGFIIQAF